MAQLRVELRITQPLQLAMRIPDVLGEGGRYQIDSEIGRGGMGAVYRARDRNTGQYVAIKVMLDSSNPEVLALFDKEWRILAELQHTNIVSINDRGEFRDGAARYPYFIMPFLRGKTLHEWASDKSASRSVPEIINVISAAASGLHAAHTRGVIHRDVKPSNIFVLDSGSVVVIDFGIVHLGDSDAMTTLKGTTPYMAPELIDPQRHERPSPQSDLFALGAVCYETLTGVQPFTRPNMRETFRAILGEIPAPAYTLNRNVSLVVGQVVQKAMAKDKNHRYRTVTEFAEKLQRAVRNEPLPEFDRSTIEDRLRIVRQALSKGQPTSADELLRSMEEEGYVDPSISAQRDKIDQALQQNWIRLQLESVRLYREAKEYVTALEKVNEVLRVLPNQPEALSEKELIDQERLSRALNDARRHLERHLFSEARLAIEEARQIQPRDTQTGELLSELARMEESDRILGEQKEALYQQAVTANRDGHLSSALLQLERLVALIRNSGSGSTSERDSIYLRFYEEVLREHGRVQKAFEDADGFLTAGKLSQTLTICDQMLATNPGHPRFQGLKLQAENKEREMRLEFVQSVCGRLANVPDLERRAALLQEAVNRYPGESQLNELLRNAKGSRDLVNSVMAKARKAEESDDYQEALERWQIVRHFHPTHPGLATEIQRIEKLLADKTRAERKAAFGAEISRFLSTGEYQRAISVCADALREFPGDPELAALDTQAQDQNSRSGEVKARIAESRELFRQGNIEDALQALRHAHAIDRNNQQARQLLGIAILDKAQGLLPSDWVAADQLLQEAKGLIPNDPVVAGVSAQIAERKQHESVDAAIARAKRKAGEGDLRGAVQDLRDCLRLHPGERRLIAERARLQEELGEGSPTVEPAPPVPAPLPGPPAEPALARPPVTPQAAAAEETTLEPAPQPAPVRSEAQRATPAPTLPVPAPISSNEGDSGGLLNAFSKRRPLIIGVAALLLLVIVWSGYRLMNRGPSPPAPATKVEVRATPGASITVDGKPVGESTASVDLAPGKHAIAAALRGYESKTIQFSPAKGLRSVSMELQPLPLSLRVVSDPPEGELWIDETKAGDLSAGDIVVPELKPGPHTLKIKGAREASVDFQFKPGELPVVSELPASARPVVLFVGTLDGKARAECNCPGAKLTIGSHEGAIEAGGLVLEAGEGDNPATLDVGGSKAFTVKVGQAPAATLALFWGAKRESRTEGGREPLDPDATLDRAEALINMGSSYGTAEALIARVLRASPGNSRAEALKARLERMKHMEPGQLK